MRLILITLLLLSPVETLFGQADTPGSKDHPLITRYPGSVIAWYDVQEYQQYKIATGPVTGYRHIDDWTEIAGKVTRIFYVLKGTRSISEVFLNYQSAVRKAGFKTVAEGINGNRNVSKAIGERGWLGVFYAENAFPSSAGIHLLAGSATSGGSAYLAAMLERPEGDIYISLGGAQYAQDEVLFMLDVIETRPVEDDLVKADADYMGDEIERTGHVALYGIYFDFNSATLKAESDPTLAEIATLLQQKPDLKLYVVGHTDAVGTLAYNMKLSKDRALSVISALTSRFQISSKRMEGHGVGPLAPVSSNAGEEGRKLNRRVELVKQ